MDFIFFIFIKCIVFIFKYLEINYNFGKKMVLICRENEIKSVLIFLILFYVLLNLIIDCLCFIFLFGMEWS